MKLEEKLFEEPKVRLIAELRGSFDLPETIRDKIFSEDVAIYGARGDIRRGSSFELILKDEEKISSQNLKWKEKKKETLNNSAGRGHGSVLDQAAFVYSIEGIPRIGTFFLCLPQWPEHEQQSMRFVKAKNFEKSIYISNIFKDSDLKTILDVLRDSFELYLKMVKNGIAIEDARYILSLNVRTNIQTKVNARSLIHYLKLLTHETPLVIKSVINKMIEKARKNSQRLFTSKILSYYLNSNEFYPSAEIFSPNEIFQKILKKYNYPKRVTKIEYKLSEEEFKSFRDNEAKLSLSKHLHNSLGFIQGLLIPLSFASAHQSIRQRTWNHSLENIYDAVERGEIVVPPSIKKSEFRYEFESQCKRMIELYKELIKKGYPKKEAILFIPHALQIYEIIEINGWNAFERISKRVCTKAQWEIRSKSWEIIGILKKETPELAKYLGPPCYEYGFCPEKNPCEQKELYLAKRKRLLGK